MLLSDYQTIRTSLHLLWLNVCLHSRISFHTRVVAINYLIICTVSAGIGYTTVTCCSCFYDSSNAVHFTSLSLVTYGNIWVDISQA